MTKRNKTVSIKIDPELYDKYKTHIKKLGLTISRRFEVFMKQELDITEIGKKA